MSTEANTTNIKEEYDKYVRQYNEFKNNIVYNDLNKIPHYLEYGSLNEDKVTFGTGKNKKVIEFKQADSDCFTLGIHHPSTWSYKLYSYPNDPRLYFDWYPKCNDKS